MKQLSDFMLVVIRQHYGIMLVKQNKHHRSIITGLLLFYFMSSYIKLLKIISVLVSASFLNCYKFQPCFFFQESELAMLHEINHIQEIIDTLSKITGDPHILPSTSEQVIADVKSSENTWSFHVVRSYFLLCQFLLDLSKHITTIKYNLLLILMA